MKNEKITSLYGDDDTIVYSKLAGPFHWHDNNVGISRSVQIMIFRGLSENTWVLDIEDENGTSFVYDDIETEQEALELAKKEIMDGEIEYPEIMKPEHLQDKDKIKRESAENIKRMAEFRAGFSEPN